VEDRAAALPSVHDPSRVALLAPGRGAEDALPVLVREDVFDPPRRPKRSFWHTFESMGQATTITEERVNGYIQALAELTVNFGARVRPGQIVALSSEPGKEAVARAVAEEAYKAGAKFVDLSVFDPYFKRARARYADAETLRFVPPWYGQRTLALGECRAARIAL